MPSPSDHSSPVSAASTSGLSVPVCELCGSASRTPSASESSPSTGRGSRAIPTCAPLWPTPDAGVFNATEDPETWLARREELKAKGINGNGMGTPLAMAVRLPTCPCQCHTSMSSAPVGLAPASATPDVAKDSITPARVFGRRSSDSFLTFDPDTWCWRTLQLSLDGEPDVFSETWPRAGMTRNGTAYRLQPLAPLTGGTGSGSLPTPAATMADRGGRGDLLQVVRGNPSPSGHFKWPTPTSRDHTGAGHANDGGLNLRTAVTLEEYGQTRRPPEGGALNPMFVEGLMGFPRDWTAI
jgi:hypothetical protein